jgi:hypothetical protein
LHEVALTIEGFAASDNAAVLPRVFKEALRRELLRSPHFLSIPMVIASTDLVVTVPAPIGELFRQIADFQVLQPPFPIPFIDVKQYWHRYQQSDPGNRGLRSIVVDLFSE